MSTTIGEWSKWESTRWVGNGRRYERTRTVRSWFGYLRQEKERIVLPYLSGGLGEALLNGANYAYGDTLEMMQKSYEERRQALFAARTENSALKQSLATMNGVAAQAIRSLEAEEKKVEALKGMNANQAELIRKLLDAARTKDAAAANAFTPAKPAKRRARR